MAKGLKNKTYVHKWVVVAVIAVLSICVLWLLVFGSEGGTHLNSSCLPRPGYACQNLRLSANVITVLLGQMTGTDWSNVSFVLVQAGVALPPASCPSSYSNFSPSCAIPNSIKLTSGAITNETFTFNSFGTNETLYSGSIWAEYHNSTGNWTTLIADFGGGTTTAFPSSWLPSWLLILLLITIIIAIIWTYWLSERKLTNISKPA